MLYRECLRVIFVVHCPGSLFCKPHLANKEASTVLRSVVEHSGGGRARKKCRGKQETLVECFLLLRVLYRCLSALQQNGVQTRLLYLFYDKNPLISPHIQLSIFN